MAEVQCDWAGLKDGREISIADATSGANGYYCLGCGHEMMARKGPVLNDHFAHLRATPDGERPCEYSSETYRHDQAKKILRRLKRVRVPAVYAACPAGYNGRLPRLAEACEVEAAHVLDERNVYVDEQGEVKFARRVRGVPFDEQQGARLLLARPDVVFLDEARRPILLIEIYATHKVTEEKITRLRILGIDAIEIYIPRHVDPAAIEKLFAVTSNTTWLYNEQQANAEPLAPDSHLLAGGSAAAATLEGGLPGRAETLQCRRSRVGHALRAVRNCLGRADIQAVQAALRAAQATGEDFTAGLEARRDERDERLGEALRKRVAERNQALAAEARELAAAEAALSREEGELASRIAEDEGGLRERVAGLAQQIKRAERVAEDAFNDGMAKLRDERWRVSAELDELSREAAAVAVATGRIEREGAALDEPEKGIRIGADTARRGRERAEESLRKFEQLAADLESQFARLRSLENAAG